MVCLFCDDAVHESEECEKYKTDEARRKRPNSNQFCFTCRADSAVAHLPEDKKCKSNESCIGWFSTEHHKIFCAERIKAMNLFLPNIDKNLLKRFSDMLFLDEKYNLATLSPNAIQIIPLNPIIIWKECDRKRKITGLNVVTGSLFFTSLDTYSKILLNAITSNNIICFPRKLSIFDLKITSEMILQMISPCTKVLNLQGVLITSKLEFCEIIKKAPNLEIISILVDPPGENIVYGKTWIKDLLKYKNGKNLRKLDVNVDTLEVDVESLVEIVKTKCIERTSLEIRFNPNLVSEEDGIKEALNGIQQKIAQYFEYYKNGKDSVLKIGFVGMKDEVKFSLEKIKEKSKEVKTRKMPFRAATKRKYFY